MLDRKQYRRLERKSINYQKLRAKKSVIAWNKMTDDTNKRLEKEYKKLLDKGHKFKTAEGGMALLMETSKYLTKKKLDKEAKKLEKEEKEEKEKKNC